MAHTPGPWWTEPADELTPAGFLPIWLVRAGEGDARTVVAELGFDAPEENAHLIAAARDLLAFAKAVAKQLARDPIPAERLLAQQAEDLIAKAEGRQP